MANIQTVTQNSSTLQRASTEPQPNYRTPAADILDSEDGYLVLADLPGVAPGDISIELEANVLSIGGKSKALDGSEQVYRREFRVGTGVDPEGISAELKQGVLHLKVNKSAAAKARRISVKAG